MELDKSEQAGRYSHSGRDKRKRTGRKLRAQPSANEATLYKTPEKHLQRAVEDYLAVCRLRYIHVSDLIGRLCGPNARLKLWEKAELSHKFKGVPDLLIFGPPADGQKYPRCLVIELKVGKNQPSPGQREWLNDVYGPEWPAWAVCRTVDEACLAINDFTKGKK